MNRTYHTTQKQKKCDFHRQETFLFSSMRSEKWGKKIFDFKTKRSEHLLRVAT